MVCTLMTCGLKLIIELLVLSVFTVNKRATCIKQSASYIKSLVGAPSKLLLLK